MNRIMIVEDDPNLAAELVSGLERWGFAAAAATHFDDILKDFAQIDPQLVLLDVNLPSFDGFWWCARIREVSDIPVGVGLGVRSREQAAEIAAYADAVIVGSALVSAAGESLDAVRSLTSELAAGVRGA